GRAQPFVKGLCQLGGPLVPEQRLHLLGKIVLSFGQKILHLLAQRIRYSLVEQGLLTLHNRLLIAHRANREPRQDQARRENRQHEHERNFFHRDSSMIRIFRVFVQPWSKGGSCAMSAAPTSRPEPSRHRLEASSRR